MTKKQLSMLKALLALLGSETLRDWTFALSEMDPEITAQHVSGLKRRLKASIRAQDKKLAPKQTRRSPASQNTKFPESEENSSVRDFLNRIGGKAESGVRRFSEQDYTRWLTIIREHSRSADHDERLPLRIIFDDSPASKKKRTPRKLRSGL